MALDLEELVERARDYVELEADTTVKDVQFVRTFVLLGEEDVALSVTVDDAEEPEWWVIAGSTPMNLYAKSQFPTVDMAFSLHVGLMMRLADRQSSSSTLAPDSVGYDAFISHATEDKEEFVRPLAHALDAMGFRVWYDEFELRVGDSLRRSIDRGLGSSRYGVVVLSPSFFAKSWPQYELDGLVAREQDERNLILPIWHNVEKDDVLAVSPALADKVALITSDLTVDEIASQLADVLSEL